MWVIIRAFVAASFERVEGEAIVVGVLGVWVYWGVGEGEKGVKIAVGMARCLRPNRQCWLCGRKRRR